ncbi:hypothetical protein [Micromonospora sp. LOL_023]|uniref:hypothetical protein n=1 Tax=Micromonospora sp. LOL_023 TaxID=3345418 RepID=UPI003A8904AE
MVTLVQLDIGRAPFLFGDLVRPVGEAEAAEAASSNEAIDMSGLPVSRRGQVS